MPRDLSLHPALAPACALLAGLAVALDRGRAFDVGPAIAAVCLLAGAACARPGLRRLALCAAAGLVGFTLGGADGSAWIDGGAVLLRGGGLAAEGDVVGRVAAAPERAGDRSRILTLVVRSADGSRPVACRVAPSSPSATAAVDRLRRGDTVRAWLRLSRPCEPVLGPVGPASFSARARGRHAYGHVKNGRLIDRLAEGPRDSWGSRLDRGRVAARATLDRILGPVGARRGIAGAMLLGDRELAAGLDVDRLRRAGLGHLTAISGLHVGLLAGGLAAALARVSARATVGVAGMPLLVAFVGLVGGRASVLRAAGAVAFATAGRALGREGRPLNTLAVVAAVLAAARPAMVADAAFQLTVAATAGILLLSVALGRAMPVPRVFALPLAVSTAAYLATLPWLAMHVGTVAPIGIVANLAAVPLCAAVLVGGYATIAAPAWAAVVQDGCGVVLSMSLDLLLAVARVAAEAPGAGLRVAAPSAWLTAAHTVGLLALAGRRWRRPGVAAIVVTSTMIVLGPPPSAPSRPRLAALDVGQGQSILVRGPGAAALLVDAGGSAHPGSDPGARVVVPALAAAGVRRLDVLALTHADVDHAGGAPAVLDAVAVGELWLPPGWHRHRRLREIAAHARRRGAAVTLVERGVVRRVGLLPVEVLAPSRHDRLDGNDASLVLAAGPPAARVLVPGDIEAPGERRLLAAGVRVGAAVLVVPHHGSRTSSGNPLIDAVGPRLAIASAGRRNPFGHPDAGVVDRLRRRGVAVRRTDRGGHVDLELSGAGWIDVGVRTRRCGSVRP